MMEKRVVYDAAFKVKAMWQPRSRRLLWHQQVASAGLEDERGRVAWCQDDKNWLAGAESR